ncbi:hypothetical protein [Streptomyces sp. NPDC021212]|uniref:hypothetical protein n=1 Tax=Streptomyces sp. NPDC021212 TaxID=3365118 RepID=UPI003797B1EF
MTALPAGVSALSRLSRLELRENGLSDVPEPLRALPRLRHLDLRWNPLDEGVDDGPAVRALVERGCVVLG